MWFILSKFLPLLVVPLGLCLFLIVLALIFRNRANLSRNLLLLLIAVIFISGNRWVATKAVQSLEWQHLPPAEIPQADAIVTLGGGHRHQDWPRLIAEVGEAGDRYLLAGHLQQEGYADTIIVSGGIIYQFGYENSEAQAILSVLKMLGVDEESVILEERSTNTYENAVETRKIVEEQGFEKILLVTSALHMPRALALFEKQGLDVVAIPTDYSITEFELNQIVDPTFATVLLFIVPDVEYMAINSRVIREYIGIAVYRMLGRL